MAEKLQVLDLNSEDLVDIGESGVVAECDCAELHDRERTQKNKP